MRLVREPVPVSTQSMRFIMVWSSWCDPQGHSRS